MTQTQIDYTAIKNRQQLAWSSGNYAVVGTTLQIVGESLCEALDLHAGERVLDVAAGNGNATLAAARRFCSVISTDYVPALLEAGRARSRAEGHEVTFEVADAEALPYEDASFDAVMSTFGVMFAPDQMRAAAQLARVCRPGGRIGLANWTPGSFIGQVFKLVGKYMPPAAGLESPSLWGTSDRLEALFEGKATAMRVVPRDFVFRYLSPLHFLEVFRTYYGPIHKTFAALEGGTRASFEHELLGLLAKGNRATDGTLVLPSEYVEVVIERG